MIIRAFITHKQAEFFADCQDRFGVNPDTKSIAVSDGMGSTWQQKIWAQLLVDTYTNSEEWIPTIESIKPLCQSWRIKVVEFIQYLKDTNAPHNMIYRNERNLVERRSAGATFVGIRFIGNEWNGFVLGDSCLIEWDGSEAKFYTSQNVDAFDSYPDYFDSDESKEGKGIPKPIGGVLTEGKHLLLVSDPFSEILLEHNKLGDIALYVQQLLSLSSHDDFETLVHNWRKEGMHNDDTTLVIIDYNDSDDVNIAHTDNIQEMVENEKSFQKTEIETAEIKMARKNASSDELLTSDKFIVVQDIKKFFIEDFLNEYQLNIKKLFPKPMMKLKLRWTVKAAEEALLRMFERYSIIQN